jgi:pimeloyl-ACP methyl ester carboxylesterase
MAGMSPERIVTANGVEICVQSAGDDGDPAILLIAGGASSMLHWPGELCERLAAGSRFVIRYDHRDTGRSVTYPPGAPGYTGQDLVDDAVGVLDALGVRAAHIVGISMGGGMAQELGVLHPERVVSLTLIATSPIGDGAGRPELPPASEDVMARFGALSEPDWTDREAVLEYLVQQELLCTSRSRPVPEAFVRELAVRTLERAAGIASINNHFLVAADDEGASAEASAITAPTLVVHGAEDPLFPFAHGAALAREVRGARLLKLEQTGHALPPAVWDDVIPAILEHTRIAAGPQGTR